MVNNNKVTSFVNALNGLVDGKEDISNKVTSLSENSTNTQYPSAKCVYDNLALVDSDDNEFQLVYSATGNNQFYTSPSAGTTPFTYNGDKILVDWGDGTTSEYMRGQCRHQYSESGDYTITFKGDITKLNTGFMNGISNVIGVKFSSTIKSLGQNAFYNTGLTSVDIPPTLTSHEGDAFRNCASLSSVKIPSTMTSLGNGLFNGCTSLTDVKIPDGVTSAGNNTFKGCTNLKTVEIPSTMTSMGYSTFQNCTSLESVRFNSETPPTLSSSSYMPFWDDVPTTCKIIVPSSKMEAYKSANNYPDPTVYKYVGWADYVTDEVTKYDHRAVSSNAVYDELMDTYTATLPSVQIAPSFTANNVTKSVNGFNTGYDHFEKVVWDITFNDNTFQFFMMGMDETLIFFDGEDCYWGEWDGNINSNVVKGNLICEGNEVQVILNKDKTITINGIDTTWRVIDNIQCFLFGNGSFSHTIYSHKYLDNAYLYTSTTIMPDINDTWEETINSITKETNELSSSFINNHPYNSTQGHFTITFNDNDFSYCHLGEYVDVYFDGTDCYWGEWDENNDNVMNKGTLICTGNVLYVYFGNNPRSVYFPNGEINYLNNNMAYFGDVEIKATYEVPRFELTNYKANAISSNDLYSDTVEYPNSYAIKQYAEKKSNKTSSWNSTTNNTRYPTEKLVKDSLDTKLTSDLKFYCDPDTNELIISPSQKYILYEWGSSDGTTNYSDSSITLETGVGDYSFTTEFDTTDNAYKFNISSNSDGFDFVPIVALTGVTDDFILRVDMKHSSSTSTNFIGLCFASSEGNGSRFVQRYTTLYTTHKQKMYQSFNNGELHTHFSGSSQGANIGEWSTFELQKDSTQGTITISQKDLNLNTYSGESYTFSFTDGENYFGIPLQSDIRFRNIRIKYL